MDRFRRWYFGSGDTWPPGVAYVLIVAFLALPVAGMLGAPVVGWPLYELSIGLCILVVVASLILARTGRR